MHALIYSISHSLMPAEVK